MSHIHQGPLATYNSLADSHLSGYFSNGRMKRHLKKAGLVNKQGEIVSESTYRLNMSRKEHKKQVKDMLAQAIVHKTLDLERTRQAEIKRKLEEISKIQLVHRVRDERTKVYEETVLPLLSPRCMQGQSMLSGSARGKRTPRSLSTHTESATHDRVLYLDDDGRPMTPANVEHALSGEQSHIDPRHLHTLDTAAIRKYAMLMSQMEEGRGVTSPYMMSQVPLPPKARLSSRPLLSSRRVQSASPKRAVITTDSRIARLHRPETAKAHPGDLQTMCRVAMKYHGWALNLAREKMDPTQEVVVEQQHCGGNTLTVFKERLTPGSTFEFVSYRHRGYPFSLTLYLDGQMDSRVSTCCEYRHSRGAKIGGKQGHFSLLGVEGAIPCYKCQVAKGVLVRNKATPRRAKRPSERHVEEVIVVSTKKDEDHKDDSEVTEWRTKQGRPVGEDEGAVLIPVEDDDNHGDKTPKSPADKDTTYDDDFDDDKSSASSRSSSSSASDSETDSSTRQRDEDYNCSKVRNKERGCEEPAENEQQEEEELQSHASRTLSSRRSHSHRKPHLKESNQHLSPERAAYTDTVTPCHSRSPSPPPTPKPPRKSRGRKKTKAAGDSTPAKKKEDDNNNDANSHETEQQHREKMKRDVVEKKPPHHPPQLKVKKLSAQTKEEADTADEVSDIESEIASPRKQEVAHSEQETRPKDAMSDLPEAEAEEEEADEEAADGLPEEKEPCRGEDDTLKHDLDPDSVESRGDDERETRTHPTKVAGNKEEVKRKGLRRNENRSKPHAASSSPERTPRSPKSTSQIVQGMELSDPSSESSGTDEDCSESSVSQTWNTRSETYTKLHQRDERAFPCEGPSPGNGYTLSSTSKDNIIRRPKAQKRRKKKSRTTASPRSRAESKADHVVEVEQPVRIPSIAVGSPASYDACRGSHQLEMVIGTEPSSRQFLQDDIYVLDVSQPTDNNNDAKETTAPKNKEQEEEGSSEVPDIVVSAVPAATIDFSTTPGRKVPEYLPRAEGEVNERGCEEGFQGGEESDTEAPRCKDSIRATADTEDDQSEACSPEKNSSHRKADADTDSSRAAAGREVCELREDGVINIVCQEPDSPPADSNNADIITISKVRRLSAELGTDSENIVLAHLQRLSVVDNDDDSAFNQQAENKNNSGGGGDDNVDGGQMVRRRRQSSLTVPLDTDALKLDERWVADHDRPKESDKNQTAQKKTVTWIENENDKETWREGDEPKQEQYRRKEEEEEDFRTDAQAKTNETNTEDGVRVSATDEDGNAVKDPETLLTNNLSQNANENNEGESPKSTENNAEIAEPATKPAVNPQENAADVYDDNDFEKDDDDDDSSTSSSSSSTTWTSDTSTSTGTSNSDSSSSSSSSSTTSASEAQQLSKPGQVRKPSGAANLSMVMMNDLLQKNRYLRSLEQAKTSLPGSHQSALKGPGSLAPKTAPAPAPESENETSDLDRSMTKDSVPEQKTLKKDPAFKLASAADDDRSRERENKVTPTTVPDVLPTVRVSYPDEAVQDPGGQTVFPVKQEVDDQGERSDVDSAYDAKMSSTTSSVKGGNIARLVEDIEIEEREKDVYSIPTNVLL